MAKKLSPDQVFELSKAFHDLATQLGDYRFSHWDELTAAQRQQLENQQWTLFNAASDLNARAVVMKTDLLADDLDTLTRAAKGMATAAKKISDIKHAIAVAAKAVAFGSALATGDVRVTVAAAKELIAELRG